MKGFGNDLVKEEEKLANKFVSIEQSEQTISTPITEQPNLRAPKMKIFSTQALPFSKVDAAKA